LLWLGQFASRPLGYCPQRRLGAIGSAPLL